MVVVGGGSRKFKTEPRSPSTSVTSVSDSLSSNVGGIYRFTDFELYEDRNFYLLLYMVQSQGLESYSNRIVGAQ